MLKNNSGNWSKTKIGAVLLGVSAILGTLGGWLTGTIDPIGAIQALLMEVGGVAVLFGVRDLPILNKVK